MKKSKKTQNKSEESELNMEANPEVVAEQTSTESAPERDWQADYNEMNDKYLRLYSEFDNYRRRTARERLDLMKTASADVLTEMIPVADDFERTIRSIEDAKESNLAAMVEGVKLVQHKFSSILERQGLTPMDAMHKEFDADFHEAITKIPAPEKSLKGKVVDVVEKGYMLNDKILRYAKVVVGE